MVGKLIVPDDSKRSYDMFILDNGLAGAFFHQKELGPHDQKCQCHFFLNMEGIETHLTNSMAPLTKDHQRSTKVNVSHYGLKEEQKHNCAQSSLSFCGGSKNPFSVFPKIWSLCDSIAIAKG